MSVRGFLVGSFRGLNNLLQSPRKVLWICLTLVVLNLVLDGSLIRLLSLYRDQSEMQKNVGILNRKTADLKHRLRQARDPAFLEREARDRFDLVSEGDLVFVFSEEGEPN